MFSAKLRSVINVYSVYYKGINIYLKRLSLLLMLLPLFNLTNGCASKEITINYDPKGGVPEGYVVNTPLNIAIIPYEDRRTGVDSKKKVVDISANVAGVHSSELLLKEDLSVFVTNVLNDQFKHMGFRPDVITGVTFNREMSKTSLSAFPSNFNIIVGGEIKRFHLNVGNRDRIEIEMTTSILDRKDGRLLWSGTVIEESDRFAGTSGNTKGSIEEYINHSLTKVIKKTLKESEPALRAFTGPSSIKQELPPSTAPLKPPSTIEQKEGMAQSTGTLVVTSTPAGARFYINDTYYGKTPVNIELKAGIHEITVRLKGFKDEKEKVAIRPGAMTELEVFLEDKK